MIIRDNICLFWIKNICCDPSSEPSRRDGSDEGSQHMISVRNKKNYPSIIIKYPLLPRALYLFGGRILSVGQAVYENVYRV